MIATWAKAHGTKHGFKLFDSQISLISGAFPVILRKFRWKPEKSATCA